jgi:hypothetical protein
LLKSADHHFCAARFCSANGGRRGFAFACSALPRRHHSTARTTLGRQPERVDDGLLRRFLSLLHVAALLLDSISLSIRRDRYEETLRKQRIPIDLVLSIHDQTLQAMAATLKAAKDKVLTVDLINSIFEDFRAIPAKLKW